MSEKFQKCVEDFQCLNCGQEVSGNGFTDHCPNCLYSKHVDINPGDRANNCRGILKPINIAPKKSGYTIFYKCLSCDLEITNKTAEQDDITNFLITLKNQ